MGVQKQRQPPGMVDRGQTYMFSRAHAKRQVARTSVGIAHEVHTGAAKGADQRKLGPRGGGVVTYPQVYHRDAPHRTRSEGVHVGPN